LATTVAIAAGPDAWRRAYAAPTVAGAGPYGPLSGPDGNGLLLPAGFTSRVIARSGEVVPGTAYVWPPFPDGAATFRAPDGGWFHAVNSEVLAGGGGASAIRYAADGTIVDAYPILRATSGNCAGGPTPWGTWLSCEETQAPSNVGEGQVWECDPTRLGQGIARAAMGRFNHEAVAVDPVGRRLYETEDRADGRFYRFTPTAYPDLSDGLLEAAVVAPDGSTTWVEVPDPSAATTTTRTQVPESTRFDGGEGCWYDAGFVYFTTKGDNRVWVHDVARSTTTVLYDAADFGTDPPLSGVDNVVVSRSGDLYVAEDGGNMEINVITPDRIVAPFLRYVDNDQSEITGPVFDPSGTRLFFSSQRGPAPSGPGITFEVRGPFRAASTSAAPADAAPVTTTTLGGVAAPAAAPPPDAVLPVTGSSHRSLVGVGAAALGAMAWRLRNREAAGDAG
jgi:secreted PhoX family phosphatase